MHMADLYPAGNVFWAVHEDDIDPEALPSSANSTIGTPKVRLFRVERVEHVFDQVVFSRDMLRCGRHCYWSNRGRLMDIFVGAVARICPIITTGCCMNTFDDVPSLEFFFPFFYHLLAIFPITAPKSVLCSDE